MTDLIRIISHFSWSSSSEFEIFHGIREYMRLRPSWTLRVLDQVLGSESADCDARILTSQLPHLRRRLHRLGSDPGPVVTVVDDAQADVRILVDDARIGELAARHLHDRGFRSLVFASDRHLRTQVNYRRKRFDGFTSAAHALGCRVAVVNDVVRTWRPGTAPARWLVQLPRPCGIFCPDDHSALIVIDCCRFAGVQVPEEIAVIGADNDALWCETALPPLSSVAIPWRRVGYEAATWVDRLLAGKPLPRGGCIVLPPDGVVARHSTDSIALTDPLLVRALEFIRANALAGVGVKAVGRAVGLDRRQLDRVFVRRLGRTPYDEIRRLQIEKAKELLACTDLTLRAISAATGLSYSYFAANFRAVVGISVHDYRQAHRRQRGRQPSIVT